MKIVLTSGLLLLAVHVAVGDETQPQQDAGKPASGTIAFSSLAKRGWDLYSQQLDQPPHPLTDHAANEYNAAYSPDGTKLAFVSERDGNVELYSANADGSEVRRLTNDVAMDDHPTWSPDGKQLAFASTRQPNQPGRSWTGIYKMQIDGQELQRLSPDGESDFSPAWSPSGDWIAFVSGTGLPGSTHLYVMRPDGSERTLVTKNAGWPAWIDQGQALAFHRQTDDGNSWNILRIDVDGKNEATLLNNASMPRSTPDGTKMAVVVRQDGAQHIGVLEVQTGDLRVVTSVPLTHWNPSITPDGNTLVYHRSTPNQPIRNVERWDGPAESNLQLLRIDGAFPAFSPDSTKVAFVSQSMATIDVMDVDGGDRATLFEGTNRSVFGVSWSAEPQRIAFSHGGVFRDADFTVNIKTVSPDGEDLREITSDAGNNGFPIYSHDGKQIVFRSGRDGQKNLYIMNRDGSSVRRLTHGDWTDTMCDWSHDGQWIAFSSTRDNNYEIWLVRPDGTDLRKLIGGGGRHNHPHFSPDDEWIVFTSQRAGYSAETISMPRQPQSYGSLFMIRKDGTDLTRLTHTSNEEGTPAWGRTPEQ